MSYKNTALTLTLVAAAALTGWTVLESLHSNALKPTSNSREPDTYMEIVNATIMNKLGQPSMKISTPKMFHYAESDTTHFINPQLILYRHSSVPWHITAKFANAVGGIDNIFFWQNVVIQHAADEGNPETTINTATLLVHPNLKIAETNDFITLHQPDTVIKAVGMTADMSTGEIKLLSQARGEYVPTP